MNTPSRAPTHEDNILVQHHRDYREFLALSLRPLDPTNDRATFRVHLYRYSVPGRCDTYSFQLQVAQHPADVRYFSDTRLPLSKALKLVGRDFDKPQVVEMCLNAFRAERIVVAYRDDFLSLLDIIAPKSKTYRRVKALCQRTMEERAARMGVFKGIAASR